MTLYDLLIAIGDYDDERVQISSEDDWETYDEFCVNSTLLKPFYDWEVNSIAAIDHNVIRADLNFKKMEGEHRDA